MATENWESKKKLLKKGKEESLAIFENLDILADPKPAQAKEITAAIAAQPADNKFAAAAKAVAVVMQVRDPIKPTVAESSATPCSTALPGSNSR